MMTPKATIRSVVVLAVGLFASATFATDGTTPGASAFERWTADPTTVFDAKEVDPAEFKWVARLVVVFADAPADPAFGQQLELLAERMNELVERDVVVITDADPAARSAIRRELRPRGFMLTLVGKDGRVVLRKPFPWDVRELTRSIDKQPLRQQELKEQARAQ